MTVLTRAQIRQQAASAHAPARQPPIYTSLLVERWADAGLLDHEAKRSLLNEVRETRAGVSGPRDSTSPKSAALQLDDARRRVIALLLASYVFCLVLWSALQVNAKIEILDVWALAGQIDGL